MENMEVHRKGQLGCAVFYKRPGRYQALIYIGKLVHLGYYKTEQKAHRAYTIACEHIDDYKDNKSFRELIKKEMEKYNGNAN
jgi:hypothetical protein